MKLPKNYSDDSIRKLMNNIFNTEKMDDDVIKNTSLKDVLASTKSVYDTSKDNLYTFPLVLKRLYDTYFDGKNVIFEITKPEETVNMNMDTDKLSSYELVFFMFKSHDIERVKYPRDVLSFAPSNMVKYNLPEFNLLITPDRMIKFKKDINLVFNVSTSSNSKETLTPRQYVLGKGMSDDVLKTNKNRLIISCKVFS